METLARGFALVEAPREAPDGSIYFSDVIRGGVYRVAPSGDVETVVPKRRGIGGMALHASGGLVVSGRDLIHVRDGETRTLLAPDGVTGFNDLTVDDEGRVLAGALRYYPMKGEPPVPGEVWMLDGRVAEPLFGGVDWPNGIGLSPDARTVYISDYANRCIIAHDRATGETGVFARPPKGSCDGLAVDEKGYLWVALADAGALGRFGPDGALDRILEVPAAFVTTVSFGGRDRRDLLIGTSDTTGGDGAALLRARADVPGRPVPRARVWTRVWTGDDLSDSSS